MKIKKVFIMETDQKDKPPKEKAKREPKPPSYCNKCGGLIDAESKKCTQCAKQYFKWTASKIIILVLSLLLIISLVINFMQFDENLSLNSSCNYWRNEADEWKTTATNLVDAGVEDYKFIRFYSTYAAIVIEDTKIYHIYGCENLDISAPFYIYNIPTAKSKGYYPCPKCHD